MPMLAGTSAVDPRRLAVALRRVSENGSSGPPSDNYERMNNIERRRNIAAALMQSQAPQGQMVGRFFVPPSPWQHAAALGSQFIGGRLDRRLDKEQAQVNADERRQLAATVSGSPQGAMDPATLEAFGMLSLPMQRQLVANRVANNLSPPAAPEPYTLSPGQSRYQGGNVIASVPAAGPQPTDDEREYERARQEGFRGKFSDWQLMSARAGASNVNVNTERTLYGTLAENRAKSISELYDLAQKAPELLQRAQRVKQLVGPDSQALTGLGANWQLGAAKVANQLGINTGDAASDTEVLMTQLAASTLDSIKSSGLGGGTGFSNADRDFLERVVGGKITLEARTISRLADLNERAALGTIQRWNATSSRLDPRQLQSLGLGQIEMPGGSPAAASQSKLQRNPDGSYTYTP